MLHHTASLPLDMSSRGNLEYPKKRQKDKISKVRFCNIGVTELLL